MSRYLTLHGWYEFWWHLVIQLYSNELYVKVKWAQNIDFNELKHAKTISVTLRGFSYARASAIVFGIEIYKPGLERVLKHEHDGHEPKEKDVQYTHKSQHLKIQFLNNIFGTSGTIYILLYAINNIWILYK